MAAWLRRLPRRPIGYNPSSIQSGSERPSDGQQFLTSPQPNDSMSQQVSRCVLCGGELFELVQSGVRYAPELSVVRCQRCRLVMLSPRPDKGGLEAYYEAGYRTEYDEPPIEDRFRADLAEASLRIARLRPLLSPSTRLLEVGAGSGAFVSASQPLVADVSAIEPELQGRSWIESHLGIRARPQIDDLMGEQFDLIVSFHVLEHTLSPVDFLKSLIPSLKPKGHLVVEVPNIDDALLSLYGIRGYTQIHYQKAHLFYFSESTLGQVLTTAGFCCHIEGVQRYDLSNHLRWALTQAPGGQGYYSDIFSPALIAAYSDALIRAGKADTLWAVAGIAGERKDSLC